MPSQFFFDLVDRFEIDRKSLMVKIIAIILIVCSFLIGYKAVWSTECPSIEMFGGAVVLLSFGLLGLGKLKRSRRSSSPNE